MKKKVEFGNLKPGQKFRYKRKLYIKDDFLTAVSLTSGECDLDIYNDLVTPVKIKITVL